MKKYLLMSTFLYALAVLVSAGGCSGEEGAEEAPVPAGMGGTGTTPPETVAAGNRYGQNLLFYAQVDKAGNYFRRMFIDSLSAQAVRQTGELPENALLVMETWFGNDQSTVFMRQKRNGQWLSGSFSPASPNFSVAPGASCNNCHARASVTDLTFTRPLLQKALQRGQVQVIACNEPSFTPCDLSIYQGN
jgi:hypothetical protein